MIWSLLLMATTHAALVNEDDYEGGGIGSGSLGSKYYTAKGGYSFNSDGDYVSDCNEDGSMSVVDNEDAGDMKDFVQEDEEIGCIEQVQAMDCTKFDDGSKLRDQCDEIKNTEGTNMINRLNSNKIRDKLCDVHKEVQEHANNRRRRMMDMAHADIEHDYHWNAETFPELRDPEHPVFKALWARRVARRRRLAECNEDGCDEPSEDEFSGDASAENFDTAVDCGDADGNGSGYGVDHPGMSFAASAQAFPVLISSSLCTVGGTDRRMEFVIGKTISGSQRRREEYYGSESASASEDLYDADPESSDYFEPYFGDNSEDGMGEDDECSSPNEFINQAADARRRLWGMDVGVASSSCGNYVIAGEANSGCNNRPCLKVTGSFGLSGGCPFYNWAVKYRRWTCNTCWACSWSSCPGWYSCNCAWRELVVVDGGQNLCCTTVDITPVWSPIDVEIEGCFFSEATCGSKTGSCGKGYKFDLNLSALFGLASYNANLACDADHQFLNCCGRRRLMPFLTDEEARAAGLLTLDDVGGNADFLNY